MQLKKISSLNKFFQLVSYNLSRVFSANGNPMYYLGAITVIMLIIDFITGIYLFIFYQIDPKLSHASVEAISNQFVGSMMRGLHRYTSDALIMTTVVHMVHVVVTGRFKSFRWIAWVTGVATVAIFLAIGLSGYILIWDGRAQLVGLLIAKFLSIIPVFKNLMSTVLSTDIKNIGGLFRALLFAHMALTLLIVFTLYFHTMRISRPMLFPQRHMTVLVILGITLFSIFFPAKSDPPANLAKIPFEMTMDWFYMFWAPLLKFLSLSYSWVIVIGTFAILGVLPWVIRGKNPEAHTDTPRCVGCEQCYIDCPYAAIHMKEETDGKKKSVINENKCSGCGICVGSCSWLVIDIPTFPVEQIFKEIDEKKPQIVAFRCPYSATPPAQEGLLTFTVSCVGAVNTLYTEQALDKGVKGVMLVGCEERDCHFREGALWAEERYTGGRRPALKKSVEPSRVRILHKSSLADISGDIAEFRKDLIDKKGFEQVEIKGRYKMNYVFASVLFFIPLLIFYPLTTHKMAYYPKDKSIVVLSFKYRSSAIKTTKGTETYSTRKHMKTSKNLVVSRSDIKVDIFVNNNPVYSKVFEPRGLRHDTSIYVYHEIPLDPQKTEMTFRLTETEVPDVKRELTVNEELKAKDSVYVTFDDEIKNFKVVQ